MGNGSAGEPDRQPATPPGQPPPDLAGLLDLRQAARERRDYATADAIRDQLRQAGWLVRDTPDGPELDPAPPYQTLDPAAAPPRWDEPDRYEASVVVHVAGWPEDVARATRALAAHHRHLGYEVLLVEDGAGEAIGRALEDLAGADPHLRVLHLDPAVGFGAAMNLAMGQALGRVLVWLDPHVEATGDLIGPLLADAVAESGRVRFGYRDRNDAASVRTTDPYRHVYRAGHWYLVGFDLDRDEWRTYRMDRIGSVERIPGTYRRRDLPGESLGRWFDTDFGRGRDSRHQDAGHRDPGHQ